MSVQLVWFKKDLRIADHRPLIEAAKRGPVLCVYVYEPEVYQANDFDSCHLVFINQSLKQLSEQLAALGSSLVILHGNLPAAFAPVLEACPVTAVWSHEETGNDLTYQRDIRMAEWFKEKGISWTELPQTGVVRRLKTRDGWARQWAKRMNEPNLPSPQSLQSPLLPTHFGLSSDVLSPKALGLPPSGKTKAQLGGELEGWKTLQSFLSERGQRYQQEMSSPVVAFDSCSRLSPYLTYGNLSMKQVVHTMQRRVEELKETAASGSYWLRSMRSFDKRLHWHCHFMQKLEDQPSIEWENLCMGFDGLRENDWNQHRFDAWCKGETGYPLIDACMRALHQHGWINFRMRAMLVSFAAYQLWLDWRPVAHYLAKQFVDYEPGIHYSQVQMQSGVTGINAIRIYSPIKQVLDQDPEGTFIKTYVPELLNVPSDYIAEPHTMPPLLQQLAGFRVGVDYPEPIVDHKEAYNAAKDCIYSAKRRPEVRELAQAVLKKHGSRQKVARKSRRKQTVNAEECHS